MKNSLWLVLSILFIFGCGPWGPALISTGTSGAYYYYNGMATEVYRISMKKAYGATLLTLSGLALKINEIKESDQRRIITAEDDGSEYRVTIDLKEMRDGKYVKATFKSLKHRIIPDRIFGRMLAKEFDKKLSEFPEQIRKTKNSKNVDGG